VILAEINLNPRLDTAMLSAAWMFHFVYDYSLINGRRKKGFAILFIGEDLDVFLNCVTGSMVLCSGRSPALV
jgi:hypothetical protein